MDIDVHNNAQPSNGEYVEIEPTVNPNNPQPKRYDKNDFTARKHGKEREPWVHRPMPFPPKPSKKKDDEDFERFVEMIRPVFLQMRLTDMLKVSPYAKYIKDIVTNKRKIPDLEISTMLANYTFKADENVPTEENALAEETVRTETAPAPEERIPSPQPSKVKKMVPSASDVKKTKAAEKEAKKRKASMISES
ncbi:hypothetical protein ZWY2020_038777 [Hordeum vulgare]|nr:hypothetical protein ZWY2020_038777 [Hordeum vulgare]